jgi:cytidine deaminase
LEFNLRVCVSFVSFGCLKCQLQAIANACGKCRQILHDYAPGIKLAINNNGMTEEVEIEALLPYAFKRQQEKIQAALKSEGDQNST